MKKNIKKRISDTWYLLCNYRKICRSDLLLIDTPIHRNLGDHAIAIAEKQFLERNFPQYSVFEIPANRLDKNEKTIAKVIKKNALILVQGGGFLGSIWKEEEYRFRRILKCFNNNPVIVFPQTITFELESEEGLIFFEESLAVYRKHKNLTVFLRDEKSFRFMKKHMECVNSYLVPDIVTELTIPKMNRIHTLNDRILICLRSDVEKNITESMRDEIVEVVNEKTGYEVCFTDTVIGGKEIKKIEISQREKYVFDKIEEFRSAKLIITDRLHGMIFSFLVGTPCIVFDNKNGKVSETYKWIKNTNYIYMAKDTNDFKNIIDNLELNNNKCRNVDLDKSFRSLVTEMKRKLNQEKV